MIGFRLVNHCIANVYFINDMKIQYNQKLKLIISLELQHKMLPVV